VRPGDNLFAKPQQESQSRANARDGAVSAACLAPHTRPIDVLQKALLREFSRRPSTPWVLARLIAGSSQ